METGKDKATVRILLVMLKKVTSGNTILISRDRILTSRTAMLASRTAILTSRDTTLTNEVLPNDSFHECLGYY